MRDQVAKTHLYHNIKFSIEQKTVLKKYLTVRQLKLTFILVVFQTNFKRL